MTTIEPTNGEIEIALLGPDGSRDLEIAVVDRDDPDTGPVHAATLTIGQARELHDKLGAALATTQPDMNPFSDDTPTRAAERLAEWFEQQATYKRATAVAELRGLAEHANRAADAAEAGRAPWLIPDLTPITRAITQAETYRQAANMLNNALNQP